MPLKAGTKANYSGSMAEAIEYAFRREWPNAMPGAELPTTTSPDLKLLFVAIAQGVIRHLKDHADSFQVDVATSGVHSHTADVEIVTTPDLYP
jgi:hypothetical protein